MLFLLVSWLLGPCQATPMCSRTVRHSVSVWGWAATRCQCFRAGAARCLCLLSALLGCFPPSACQVKPCYCWVLTEIFGECQPSAGPQTNQNLLCPLPSHCLVCRPGTTLLLAGMSNIPLMVVSGAEYFACQCHQGSQGIVCHWSLCLSSPAECRGSSLPAHKGKSSHHSGCVALSSSRSQIAPLSSPRRSCSPAWLSQASETGTTLALWASSASRSGSGPKCCWVPLIPIAEGMKGPGSCWTCPCSNKKLFVCSHHAVSCRLTSAIPITLSFLAVILRHLQGQCICFICRAGLTELGKRWHLNHIWLHSSPFSSGSVDSNTHSGTV